MNSFLTDSACVLVAYLVGAIPTGYLIARAKGIDIRKVGSGNIGATNVFRALGKGWGITTLVADIIKGYLPVHFLPALAVSLSNPGSSRWLPLICAAAAVAGHNWPVYLRFKGGKGVATSAGVLAALAPAALGIGLAAWLVVFAVSRYVSLASICAAVAVSIASWCLYMKNGPVMPTIFTILALGLVWRHRSNIARLIAGTENRIGKKQSAEHGSSGVGG